MGASSVTGTGLGASGGKQKPDNHITCCGPKVDPQESQPPIQKGCVVRYRTGNKVAIRVGGGKTIKVCG